MKSVPNFEVMKHYLLREGFKQKRPTGVYSSTFYNEFGTTLVIILISEDCEHPSDTVDAIRDLASRANISERGMISRIIKSWVNAHLMRPTK